MADAAKGTELKRAVAAFRSPLSTTPVPPVAPSSGPAEALRARAEASRTLQLRGIFAAFDKDADGLLVEEELASALLALGLDASRATLRRIVPSSSRGVDFATFIRACAITPGAPDGALMTLPSSAPAIIRLLSAFDPAGTGRIPLATLLHVLGEVHTPTVLSLEEVQELLRLTGVLSAASAADPETLYAMEVAYGDFVEHLCFIPRPAGTRGALIPAAAPGRARKPLDAAARATGGALRVGSYNGAGLPSR